MTTLKTNQVLRIGAGSFASVSMISGRPVAFKHVHLKEHSSELRKEFEMFCALDICRNNSLFAVPRPLAFYDCEDITSFVTLPNRPRVSLRDFKQINLPTAAYAMDLVPPIPLSTAETIRTLFYPPNASKELPTLCRLYLGKVITDSGRPNRFFNSANFPLDEARYCKLMDTDTDGPTPEAIAYGMGEFLGRLHWGAGFDGRDIEFIMGAEFFSEVKMNVIDFNQMRHWNKTRDEIPLLVDAFFANDPYYPRPIPANDTSLFSIMPAAYAELVLNVELVSYIIYKTFRLAPLRPTAFRHRNSNLDLEHPIDVRVIHAIASQCAPSEQLTKGLYIPGQDILVGTANFDRADGSHWMAKASA